MGFCMISRFGQVCAALLVQAGPCNGVIARFFARFSLGRESLSGLLGWGKAGWPQPWLVTRDRARHRRGRKKEMEKKKE
jgi:hypothetical protein